MSLPAVDRPHRVSCLAACVWVALFAGLPSGSEIAAADVSGTVAVDVIEEQAATSPEPLDALRARAEQGDLSAQVRLGDAYVSGEGVEVNPAEARQLVPPGRRTRRYRRPNQAREPLPHGCPRDRQGLGRGTPLADTIASTLSPREREADIRIDREAVAREMKPEDATRAEAHAREWLERVARHPLPRLEARAG
jgi:hypothetical protein